MTIVKNNTTTQQPSTDIIIVDADKTNQTLLEYVFSQEGYVTQSFKDPLQALEQYESLGPQALIINYHLPKITGLELSQRLKESYGMEIPIIGVSTTFEFANEKDVNTYFNRTFEIPYQGQDVLNTVKEYISTTPASDK